MWKRSKDDLYDQQLATENLRRPTKGWLHFICSTLMPTGNTSEITLERATLLAHILAGDDVDFGEVISRYLTSFLRGPPLKVLYRP
ncbi:hypothetical protein Syun_004749 [Stephania yunnanensis]|uniref:Putative plant transposon protein domain-containing protein n=1 Tax=Stephania yunnanensis TaxID=152371 RepID=A0AAP0L534_9MAGN